MRRSRAWWALLPVGAIGLLLAAATPDKVQSTTDIDTTPPATPATEPVEQLSPETAAILDIRRQVGEDLLGGTVFEQEDGGLQQAGFVDALRQAAASEPPILDEPEVGAEEPQAKLGLRSSDPLEASLFEASIQLDEAALRLESQHEFGRADELRKLSSRLRRQIRALVERDR